MYETISNPIEFIPNLLFVFVFDVSLFPNKVHLFKPIFAVHFINLRLFISFEIILRKEPFNGIPEFGGSRKSDIT